jgi:hypothetical protein
MRKSDAECPHCHAGFQKIEVSSLKGEPGEYHCPVCHSLVETVSGPEYVAYRLTVRPRYLFAEVAQSGAVRSADETTLGIVDAPCVGLRRLEQAAAN